MKSFDLHRINHSERYADDEDSVNQAESFFSRMRRCVIGQHHHVSNLYVSNYANEIAYREDTRRLNNGAIFRDILTKTLKSGISKEWKGYWQGNHRQEPWTDAKPWDMGVFAT